MHLDNVLFPIHQLEKLWKFHPEMNRPDLLVHPKNPMSRHTNACLNLISKELILPKILLAYQNRSYHHSQHTTHHCLKYLLLQFSGRTSFDGKPAINWVARLLFAPATTGKDKVFLINNPDIPMALGVEPDKKRRYSFVQLQPGLKKLSELAQVADQIEEKNRSIVDFSGTGQHRVSGIRQHRAGDHGAVPQRRAHETFRRTGGSGRAGAVHVFRRLRVHDRRHGLYERWWRMALNLSKPRETRR